LSEAEAALVNETLNKRAKLSQRRAGLFVRGEARNRRIIAADEINLFDTKWLLQGDASPFEFFQDSLSRGSSSSVVGWADHARVAIPPAPSGYHEMTSNGEGRNDLLTDWPAAGIRRLPMARRASAAPSFAPPARQFNR
jgi:hypothetical protein